MFKAKQGDKVITRESLGLPPYNPKDEPPMAVMGQDNSEYVAYLKKKYHK